MTESQFAEYLPKYEGTINAIARKLAGADEDLYEDLVSCGRIGLWEIDLRRPMKNADAYIRNVIRNRMITHIRWLDPQRFERLSSLTPQGVQVVRDESTGEPVLVYDRTLNRDLRDSREHLLRPGQHNEDME